MFLQDLFIKGIRHVLGSRIEQSAILGHGNQKITQVPRKDRIRLLLFPVIPEQHGNKKQRHQQQEDKKEKSDKNAKGYVHNKSNPPL
jgi:hypothetical protein